MRASLVASLLILAGACTDGGTSAAASECTGQCDHLLADASAGSGADASGVGGAFPSRISPSASW
jgi:hypothetical protein